MRLLAWNRLLLGNAPAGFLLELVVRVAVIYSVLLVLVRLLGKRMSGQVSNLELAVMMVLGAIVSPPFQMPERGMLPALVLLGGVLILHQGLTQLGARSRRAEEVTQGRPTLLLEDGRLHSDALHKAGLSNDQLFAVLRTHSVTHLGELKRVYFEACGEFSLLRASEPKPGLSVQPESDERLQAASAKGGGAWACRRCGHVVSEKNRASRCEHCGSDTWAEAVVAEARTGSE
jgi:uncharacterized membrane protein YcaP (DUF421 family)